ncbi:excalibur calcium-binding domain-containing protein [Pseudomonas sp. 5P_3.1_Bac2]|uniref:excalibur calcium-binding domain-containing protein n=1 Tax=Pseudomonas sp. 5P_3.1_Bac2 TaxID=2971617 RepID=UPI0021C9007F|nr:excalibur calcium-binding domain-containing protein [Pseudomonas sp. 5P_3.1_Bac2]MCU1717718.1 excalibur calcium-binding domain-containing protein [Pseudomonas sp. 5P_3.1_Bac2]
MKKLLVLIVLAALAWQLYLKPPASPLLTNINRDGSIMSQPVIEPPSNWLDTLLSLLPGRVSEATTGIEQALEQSFSSKVFRCDGRTDCSQMTSCAEATYFLRSCPGAKMDADNNGVACAKQWCSR